MVEEYKNRFKKAIDPMCPSEKTSELIMSYLYSMVVTSLARANPDDEVLQEERASCMELSPMMDMSFEKAVRDMLVFSSHNILMDSIDSAFKAVKNIAEINYRKPGMEAISVSSKSSGPQMFSADDNVAEFDIMDLDSIPKVDPSILRQAVQTAQAQRIAKQPLQLESNEFEGDFDMDFDRINSEVPIITQGRKESDEETPDQLDAGAFTSEVYKGVPKVSISTDY